MANIFPPFLVVLIFMRHAIVVLGVSGLRRSNDVAAHIDDTSRESLNIEQTSEEPQVVESVPSSSSGAKAPDSEAAQRSTWDAGRRVSNSRNSFASLAARGRHHRNASRALSFLQLDHEGHIEKPHGQPSMSSQLGIGVPRLEVPSLDVSIVDAKGSLERVPIPTDQGKKEDHVKGQHIELPGAIEIMDGKPVAIAHHILPQGLERTIDREVQTALAEVGRDALHESKERSYPTVLQQQKSRRSWMFSAAHEHSQHTLIRSITLLVLCLSLAVALLALVCLICGRRAVSKRASGSAATQMRRWIETHPVRTGGEIIATTTGYDCIVRQPMLNGEVVRIEARVHGLSGSLLHAPLAKRTCVFYSTSAAEIGLDGADGALVANNIVALDFEVQTCSTGAPVRIGIMGQSVALFDMVAGSNNAQMTMQEAPAHLQDFVRANTIGGVDKSALMGPTVLQFRETMLEVDAVVTVIGELRHTAAGAVQILPLHSNHQVFDSEEYGGYDGGSDSECEEQISPPQGGSASAGLTSWERTGITNSHSCKVMITDNPYFLKHKTLAKATSGT